MCSEYFAFIENPYRQKMMNKEPMNSWALQALHLFQQHQDQISHK